MSWSLASPDIQRELVERWARRRLKRDWTQWNVSSNTITSTMLWTLDTQPQEDLKEEDHLKSRPSSEMLWRRLLHRAKTKDLMEDLEPEVLVHPRRPTELWPWPLEPSCPSKWELTSLRSTKKLMRKSNWTLTSSSPSSGSDRALNPYMYKGVDIVIYYTSSFYIRI